MPRCHFKDDGLAVYPSPENAAEKQDDGPHVEHGQGDDVWHAATNDAVPEPWLWGAV